MTQNSERLLIVIPALNEQESIREVISSLRDFVPGSDVLVVDDGSQDKTAEYALNAGALVLSLPFNLGVGGAMRLGFKFALRSGYTQVIQVDADGQHDAKDVLRIVSKLKDFDVVIGARFAGVGEYKAKGPRKIAMNALASALSRISGEQLTDVTSGFRAANIRAIKYFSKDYPREYLGDTVESLLMANKVGLSISQVPVQMHERQAGTPSQNAIKASVYLARALMALAFSVLRRPVSLKLEAE